VSDQPRARETVKLSIAFRRSECCDDFGSVLGFQPSSPLRAFTRIIPSEYDDQRSVEFEGTLLDVAWQNPHVRFMVEAKDANDRVVVWDVESTSVNSLHRLQVPLDILTVGRSVKVTGWPSKRAGNRIHATNLLAPDGREVVLWRYSTPRWATMALGIGAGVHAEGDAERARACVIRDDAPFRLSPRSCRSQLRAAMRRGDRGWVTA
jgi:hypothetical protein